MGRNIAIDLPTVAISDFFLSDLKSSIVMRSRLSSIRKLPPSTASLFGVMPHSAIRNRMADRAIPLTAIVTVDKRKSTQAVVVLLLVLELSATEKKMMAITPINSKLKMIRNSRSL